MKLLNLCALLALGVMAVAFSPGPLLLSVLVMTMLAVAFGGPAFNWLKKNLLTSAPAFDGHGHINMRVDGPGAGGRHGPSRSIIFALVLIVWALILSAWSRIGHAVMKLATSAGHRLAIINLSAQPLPS